MKIEIFTDSFIYLEDEHFNPFYFNINIIFEFHHITNQVFLRILSNIKYINFSFYDILVNRIIYLHPNTIFNVHDDYPNLKGLLKNVLLYSKLNKATKKYIFNYYQNIFEQKAITLENFSFL
jgi:hypothetical protein